MVLLGQLHISRQPLKKRRKKKKKELGKNPSISFLIKRNPHLPLLSSPHRRLIDKVSRIRVLTPAGIYYMRTFFWRQEVFREFAWLLRRENRAESWGYLSKSERRPVVRLLWTWRGRGGRRQDRAAGRILPPCAAGRDR